MRNSGEENSSECIEINDRILNACEDYRYLLERGYPQKSSLDLISGRYALNRSERSLIMRCVHRKDYLERIRGRIIKPDNMRGELILIDLFNVLSTLSTALAGGCIYLCDDGFARDIGGIRSIESNESVHEASDLIVSFLRDLGVREIIYVADKSRSKSKEISRILTDRSFHAGLLSSYLLAEKADREIIDLSTARGGVVVSSDFLVLEKALKVFDLAGFIIRSAHERIFRTRIVDLMSILEKRLK
ncbi:MAG: DUF434 domain-containing protein [Sulfolobales archaeon]